MLLKLMLRMEYLVMSILKIEDEELDDETVDEVEDEDEVETEDETEVDC